MMNFKYVIMKIKENVFITVQFYFKRLKHFFKLKLRFVFPNEEIFIEMAGNILNNSFMALNIFYNDKLFYKNFIFFKS